MEKVRYLQPVDQPVGEEVLPVGLTRSELKAELKRNVNKQSEPINIFDARELNREVKQAGLRASEQKKGIVSSIVRASRWLDYGSIAVGTITLQPDLVAFGVGGLLIKNIVENKLDKRNKGKETKTILQRFGVIFEAPKHHKRLAKAG